MYFYKIGGYVLQSDKMAVRIETATGSNEIISLKFDDTATVNVIEEGDEYSPDEER